MTVEYKMPSSMRVESVNLMDSLQREEARQKKLGKSLEWDQDKPTLDEDGLKMHNKKLTVQMQDRRVSVSM